MSGLKYVNEHLNEDWLPVLMALYKYYFIPDFYQVTTKETPVSQVARALIDPIAINNELHVNFISGLDHVLPPP